MAVPHAQFLDSHVFDENKVVTYRYLSQRMLENADEAKRILTLYAESKGDALKKTYCITGTTEEGYSVKLTTDNNLEKSKASFKKVDNVHIYSVQTSVPDAEGKPNVALADALYNTDFEVQHELFTRLDEPRNCMKDNSLSAIANPNIRIKDRMVRAQAPINPVQYNKVAAKAAPSAKKKEDSKAVNTFFSKKPLAIVDRTNSDPMEVDSGKNAAAAKSSAPAKKEAAKAKPAGGADFFAKRTKVKIVDKTESMEIDQGAGKKASASASKSKSKSGSKSGSKSKSGSGKSSSSSKSKASAKSGSSASSKKDKSGSDSASKKSKSGSKSKSSSKSKSGSGSGSGKSSKSKSSKPAKSAKSSAPSSPVKKASTRSSPRKAASTRSSPRKKAAPRKTSDDDEGSDNSNHMAAERALDERDEADAGRHVAPMDLGAPVNGDDDVMAKLRKSGFGVNSDEEGAEGAEKGKKGKKGKKGDQEKKGKGKEKEAAGKAKGKEKVRKTSDDDEPVPELPNKKKTKKELQAEERAEKKKQKEAEKAEKKRLKEEEKAAKGKDKEKKKGKKRKLEGEEGEQPKAKREKKVVMAPNGGIAGMFARQAASQPSQPSQAGSAPKATPAVETTVSSAAPMVVSVSGGRKKISVPRTYVDDEGYTVTEYVDQWVDDDTAAPSAPQEKAAPAPKPAAAPKETVAPGKAKQASVMNFFGKK